MQQTSKQYDDVIEKCRSLYSNKLKDYGCAWRILRLPSLTDQIFIKAQRIRQLQQNTTRKVDEGEVSEFIGIINYSVMALIQLEKGVVEQPDLAIDEAIELYDKHISITHSFEFAAVLISEQEAGIDIEKNREKIKITITREEDGTNLEMRVNGFSPNEFREHVFNAITAFTNDFNNEKQ